MVRYYHASPSIGLSRNTSATYCRPDSKTPREQFYQSIVDTFCLNVIKLLLIKRKINWFQVRLQICTLRFEYIFICCHRRQHQYCLYHTQIYCVYTAITVTAFYSVHIIKLWEFYLFCALIQYGE